MSRKNIMKTLLQIINTEINNVKTILSNKADLNHSHDDRYGLSWRSYGTLEFNIGDNINQELWRHDRFKNKIYPALIAVKCSWINHNGGVSGVEVVTIPIIPDVSGNSDIFIVPNLHSYYDYGTIEFQLDPIDIMILTCRFNIANPNNEIAGAVVEVMELVPMKLY